MLYGHKHTFYDAEKKEMEKQTETDDLAWYIVNDE